MCCKLSAPLAEFLAERSRKFRSLVAWRYGWGFYYGERLRDYPARVAMKMLLSRFAFLSQLPLVLPDKHFLVNYYGAKLYLKLYSHPVFMDVALGAYEYWKTRLFFDLVREGMTIMDIGAAEGNYSILFARLMRDKGRVLAFEPEPDMCEWIRSNIEVNKYKCIEVHQYALADKEGSATFYPGGGLGSLVSRPSWQAQFQKEPITVRARRLDDVLDELDIHEVDIIKIDVEGSDILVLRGAERTLRSKRVHLLMDVDVTANTEREELFQLLDCCGFEIYSIGRELKRIRTANELFLFPSHSTGEELKPRRIKTHQMVREIYATKPE